MTKFAAELSARSVVNIRYIQHINDLPSIQVLSHHKPNEIRRFADDEHDDDNTGANVKLLSGWL